MENAKGTEKVTAVSTTSASEEEVPWGTKQMGPPAAPSAHPQNQAAAYWGQHRSAYEEQPYVLQHVPVQQHRASQSPMENILDAFESWTKKAETLASNVWHNSKP